MFSLLGRIIETAALLLDIVSTRYPEWRRAFVERLPLALRDPEAKLTFERNVSTYFRGELPHCKEIITSTLLGLLDNSTIHAIYGRPTDGCHAISRVSRPWPGRTKEALRTSLANGIFADFGHAITPNPAVSMPSVYLTTAIMDGLFSSLLWRCMSPKFHVRL